MNLLSNICVKRPFFLRIWPRPGVKKKQLSVLRFGCKRIYGVSLLAAPRWIIRAFGPYRSIGVIIAPGRKSGFPKAGPTISPSAIFLGNRLVG